MARAAHAFAMENPNIRADVVEVQEYPVLAQRYRVQGVPKTVINDKLQFVGAVPERQFVDAVLRAVGLDEAQEQGAASAETASQESGPSSRV